MLIFTTHKRQTWTHLSFSAVLSSRGLVEALTASAAQRARLGWAEPGGPERIRGGKSPKQELMSIIVLGKNKSHLKSLRIPKQPPAPVTYDEEDQRGRPGSCDKTDK